MQQKKNIRIEIKRQLEINHPYWKKMKRKDKKKLVDEIMNEVINDYGFSQSLNIPIEKLTGIEDQVPSIGIRTLAEMVNFFDNLFDDQIINSLLAPPNYSAPYRNIMH